MPFLGVFRLRRSALLFALGFSSGLPLFLTGQTLSAWLSTAGVSLASIGTLALVGLPYTFKWAWAPLLDRYPLPFLGRRRGWLLLLQLGLVGAIGALGTADPLRAPALLAALAVAVAFLSASQDVVLDAYNAETLRPEERAAGIAVYVLGYRAGMVTAGTAALFLAAYLPWSAVYLAMAALQSLGIVATLLSDEPDETRPARSLAEAIVDPILGLLRPRRALLVLAFVATYKLGDHFLQILLIPFLQRGAGFSLPTIATVNQAVGFAGVLAGGLLAGAAVPRLGLRKSLLLFGAAAAATNLLYAGLALRPSTPLLCVAALCDQAGNAAAAAAFVAFLMQRCDHAVTATQMALLSSLSSVGARLFGRFAGELAAGAGWPTFFVATTALALPALLLLRFLPIRPDTPADTAAPPASSGNDAAPVAATSK